MSAFSGYFQSPAVCWARGLQIDAWRPGILHTQEVLPDTQQELLPAEGLCWERQRQTVGSLHSQQRVEFEVLGSEKVALEQGVTIWVLGKILG